MCVPLAAGQRCGNAAVTPARLPSRPGHPIADDAQRPGYCAAVTDLVVRLTRTEHPPGSAAEDGGAAGVTVVELGAGTGKFTADCVSALSRAGVTLRRWHAVEPVPAMLDVLKAHKIPGVLGCAGTAERTGLGWSGEADLVVAAQAFHWFATPETLAEARRLLRAGGRLVLVWNTRDTADPWMGRMEREVIDPLYPVDVPRQQSGVWREVFSSPAAAALFGPLQHEQVRESHALSRDALLGRVMSLSVVGALGEGARGEVERQVRRFLAEHAPPPVPGTDLVAVPYVTDLYWCEAR